MQRPLQKRDCIGTQNVEQTKNQPLKLAISLIIKAFLKIYSL